MTLFAIQYTPVYNIGIVYVVYCIEKINGSIDKINNYLKGVCDRLKL